MIINKLIINIKRFYFFFITSSKEWRLPKKSDILMYDNAGENYLEPYLKNYSVTNLVTRKTILNIPCLLKAFLKLNFYSKKLINTYYDIYIQTVSPKLIITFIDNNINYYSLSNRHPNIKTMFIQNAYRSHLGDVFDGMTKSKDYHVDYMLVFGSAIAKKYKKYISGSTLIIGSFKNNFLKKSNIVLKDSIVFVSQYRDKPKNNQPFLEYKNGEAISYEQMYLSESLVLNFLSQWCIKNKKSLKIAGASNNIELEKNFFKNFLPDSDWEFIPNVNESSYAAIDSAKIVVFIDSTLGYEALARGKRGACFSCRTTYSGKNINKFGWPANMSDNGPFWTNLLDEKEFRRIMNYLIKINDIEWDLARQKCLDEIIEFDLGNSKFINLLNRILPKKNSI